MWKKSFNLLKNRAFSTESEISTLYSFLQPSIFALRKTASFSQQQQPQNPQTPTLKTLSQDQKSDLESTLCKSLSAKDTDEAWKSFKTLINNSVFPNKVLTNSLITHLSSLNDIHNLKRAYASIVYVIEKNPKLLDFETIGLVLSCMNKVNTAAPAFALVNCMFKNRFFVPFSIWGNVLVEVCKKTGSFVLFLRIFEQNCKIALDENLDFMRSDLTACNAALEGCCYGLESVTDAENVIEKMSVLGVRPDESTFGFLAYLYALKGLEEKIVELEGLMRGFCFTDTNVFYINLISGYLKSGKLESVSFTILRRLREGDWGGLNFSEDTYRKILNGYLQNGNIKDLAALIIEAQKLQPASLEVDKSIGYCIVTACVNLGFLDKAHTILDKMNAQGGSIGLGFYVSILKAYGKEHRTAEAAQLVADISGLGLQLDVETYDALIDASMSSQDFQSAFSIYRDMRKTRVQELYGCYLTIMAGLTENHQPELMAAFLDEVVEDSRVQVGTHDWNSVIHAFCKVGRLDDAQRTLRRMQFLHYKPNDQTYLSLINGYVTLEKYFPVLVLWSEVKRRISTDREKGIKFENNLVDAFLYAMVKGGFYDAVMQVVEKSQEKKIFVDKWKYKQAFVETRKRLRVAKIRKRNIKKMESLTAFKNWAGLNS